MAVGLDASRRLVEALREVVGGKGKDSTRAYATCTRIDKDGTRWVRLIGSDTDTPVNGSTYFQSELNDLLEVEVSDGVMSIVGNVTSPAVGQAYVNNAMSASRVDMALQLGDTVKELISDFGTILTSALSSYMTSGQTASAISAAINAAFNMSSATSKITQAFATAFNMTDSSSYASVFTTYLQAYVIGPAITVAVNTLNNSIEQAVGSIKLGGRNLLNSTGWDHPSDIFTVSSPSSTGGWYKEADASASYDSSTGLMVITTQSSSYWGYTQKVNVEPSTKYIISAEVGSSYHIGIGSSTYPTDTGDWNADGKRVWKEYETASDQTTLNVYLYALGGSSASPCEVNRVMLERTSHPSEWDFNLFDAELLADAAITVADNAYAAVMSMAVVQRGTVSQSQSVSANGYRDYEITFDDEFDSVPVVTATIYTTTEATTSFNCDIYLRSVSKTGFTARIINREGASRSPGFHWQAVGVLAD